MLAGCMALTHYRCTLPLWPGQKRGATCVEYSRECRETRAGWQQTTDAETRDRSGDLQIFSLTLSQLSYRGLNTTLG